jgi:uncharacterized repeat protein (TIGR03943 family)
VSEEVGSFIAVLCGIVLLRLRLGGSYTVYVKPSMGRWLLLAGILLTVLGAVGLLRWYRGDAGQPEDADHDHAADDDHGHDHSHTPKVALLLVLPVLAVFVVKPVPLGSFAASRTAGNARLVAAAPPAAPAAGTTPDTFPTTGPSYYDPPAAPRDGASDMRVSEYVPRALYDPIRALGNTPIRLVGIVTPRPSGEGFRLTRFTISCCAADAYPIQVDVVGLSGPLPHKDAWVEVVGHYEPGVDEDIPRLRADRILPTSQPTDPYE